MAAISILILFFSIIINYPVGESFAAGFKSKIDEILALPEDKIDIGLAALILAKEIHPYVDVRAYSARIDEMVEKARVLTKGSQDPNYRVRALNTYLYKIEGIKYDLSDPTAEKPQNRHLNGILDTKKGSCVTMPLLYLAIAQRLGYPVYPVVVPQHIFLRYIDPRFKMQNIEATGGGGYSPDEEYAEVLKISKKGIESGAYLRTLTYREFLAALITDDAVYWAQQGMHKRAISYLKKCVKVNPKSPEIHNTLGRVYLSYSPKLSDEKLVGEYRAKAEVCFQKADELGITRLPHGNYIDDQKKAQENYRRKQEQMEAAK